MAKPRRSPLIFIFVTHFCIKLNSKYLIDKLVDAPPSSPSSFWAKQTKLAKRLLSKYPQKDFWLKVSFPQKYEDLLYLMGKKGDILIKALQRQFYYKNPHFSIEYNRGPQPRGRKKTLVNPHKKLIDFDK